MKISATILLSVVFWGLYGIASPAITQERISSVAGDELENLASTDAFETEDDHWLQEMNQFENNPINLNQARPEDLRELKILTDLQIANFISYRQLLGNLIHLYELQAVPGWDLFTIKKVLPFITVSDPLNTYENLKKRIRSGDHTLLLRFSQVLEKSKGYRPDSSDNYYRGQPEKIFFRYRYQYKNLLQYGLIGEKDAGEPFLRSRQKYGFDFYSFHLFVSQTGMIQSLAVGDFTVNLGQGLIQWQSLAFRKGIDISAIKRQSRVLRPYNSAGEYNFHRGVGLTLRHGHIEITAFASLRKLSANFITDSVSATTYFSSFLTSGNHRTQAEMDDRNNLRQTSWGGNISWNVNRFHLGMNGIKFSFSHPFRKSEEPYNLFAMSGKDWRNYSLDYSYTRRNFHFFGEVGLDSPGRILHPA